MREHRIQIDRTACVGCGLCRKDCPESNIRMDGGKAETVTQSCMKCGHCVAICPKGAVSMTGFDEPPVPVEGAAGLEPQRLLAAIRSRRSVRQFTDEPVAAAAIAQIIEAGRLTPTAKNAQDVSYLVLTDGLNACEKLAVRMFRKLLPFAARVEPAAKRMRIDDHFFFKQAPAAIVVVSRNPVDGALAASNMALMAEACGLGVLYSGFFTMAANRCRSLRKRLGLKRGARAVTTLVLGHSAVTYHRSAQREKADVRVI